MPEMDGYAFISQVRASGYLKNIPMVMLSGSDSTENKIRCLESGADDFMVKPFNPRELSARLNGILRRNGKK
jgi:DNA-binding response OmpR family regulator